MRWWLLCAVAGCIEPSLVTCPESGLVCPSGEVCDDAHHTCVTPEQQQVCLGLPDGATCSAGAIHGFCTDQICFPIACGNAIVEPGEVCDDGNASSGDGCNATCTSTEVCGNGFVDPGEACDDANHISGDGCDSRCQVEQETWTVTGVGMRYIGAGHTVHDPAHHQLVHVSDAATWTWDGARWSLLLAAGFGDIQWGWDQLVYASDRGSALLLGQKSSLPIEDVLWEWNGTAWTSLPVVGAGPRFGSGPIITYDSVRHQLLALGTTNNYVELWALDPATGVWTQLAPPAANILGPQGQGFAFDATRGVAVYVKDGSTVYEWNGTAWAAKLATMAQPDGWAVVYDASLGAVIAVGGGTGSTSVQTWTGASWTTLAAMPSGRSLSDVAYDADRDRLVVFAGKDAGNNDLTDLLERHGTTWANVPIIAPTFTEGFGSVLEGYDTKRDELVTLGGPAPNGMTDAWAWNGTAWRRLPPLPVTFDSVAPTITYDPVRDAFVVAATDASTWLLHADTWTALQPAGMSNAPGIVAATYDPSRGAIVGTDLSVTWALGSTASNWIQIAPAPETTFFQSWAFDPRKNRLLVVGYQNCYELIGTTWKQTLSPGVTFKAVADLRRGSLVFVGEQGSRYERIDGTWHEAPPLAPTLNFGFGMTYAPSTGTLRVLGSLTSSRLLFERTFVGTSSLDACDGTDRDGDGLAGCADPDCWLVCTPACPPYASCP